MTTLISKVAYEILVRDAVWPTLPVVIADVNTGEIVYSSAYGASVFGYAPEELLGKSVETLIPPATRQSHTLWRQDMNNLKAWPTGLGRRLEGLRKDGTTFPVHVGLVITTALERSVGVALVVELTAVVGGVPASPVIGGVSPELLPPAGFVKEGKEASG